MNELTIDRNFDQKKVSVIIPTYNRAKFIPNAISSIISQGYGNIEIIIVDDGSNDNTRAVINSLLEKHLNIIYCKNERSKGPSGARNTGIMKASGDYLSFLDSDDIWLDGHLLKGVTILNKYPEIDVLFGNYSVVDFYTGKHLYNFFEQKKTLHTLKSLKFSSDLEVLQDNLFKALIKEGFFSLVSSIIRKSSCKNILLDESITFSEDRDFAIKLYKEANATFAYRINPVFIAYRHGSNICNTTNINPKKVLEDHVYLFTKYLRDYNLMFNEKRILKKIIAEKFSNLFFLCIKNKEYRDAFFFFVKSFEYSITFRQLQDLVKALITSALIPKTKNM